MPDLWIFTLNLRESEQFRSPKYAIAVEVVGRMWKSLLWDDDLFMHFGIVLCINTYTTFSNWGSSLSVVKPSLSNNSIWGTLPDNIADFKSLEFLDISYKLFSSSLPLGIGKLGSLQNLSLAENNFSWLFQKWPPSSPSTWLAWEYASRKFGLINYSRTWKVS